METEHKVHSNQLCQVGDYTLTYKIDGDDVTVSRRPLPGEEEHLDRDLPDILTRITALSRHEFEGRTLKFRWKGNVIEVNGAINA